MLFPVVAAGRDARNSEVTALPTVRTVEKAQTGTMFCGIVPIPKFVAASLQVKHPHTKGHVCATTLRNSVGEHESGSTLVCSDDHLVLFRKTYE